MNTPADNDLHTQDLTQMSSREQLSALMDGALPADCRPAPDSKAAAIAVVKLYYSALAAGDYDTAWLQWGENGPPKQTPEGFRAGFAHTRSTRVTIGAQALPSAGCASTSAGMFDVMPASSSISLGR